MNTLVDLFVESDNPIKVEGFEVGVLWLVLLLPFSLVILLLVVLLLLVLLFFVLLLHILLVFHISINYITLILNFTL